MPALIYTVFKWIIVLTDYFNGSQFPYYQVTEPGSYPPFIQFPVFAMKRAKQVLPLQIVWEDEELTIICSIKQVKRV
jgi:hypothetical protein